MTTFSRIYIHIVFRVKYPYLKLYKNARLKVYRYIAGIIKNHGHKPIIINGTEDHIHILIGLKPDVNISQLVKEIKRCSCNYINQNKLIRRKFNWQNGFGVFSYGHTQLKMMCNYIQNQENHHGMENAREELIKFLDNHEIKYDLKWI